MLDSDELVDVVLAITLVLVLELVADVVLLVVITAVVEVGITVGGLGGSRWNIAANGEPPPAGISPTVKPSVGDVR